MTDRPPRKLHRGHFAFMRALAQGLDERASWDRYLRLEGEHADLRTVRRTIAWIRDAFAAAARREQKPGTARLILLDPTGYSDKAPALPSLAEFAQAQGLEDFSEAEQVEAYEEAYPPASRGGQGGRSSGGQPSRRARVIERQLEALRWLEGLIAQDPKPLDGVAAWLNPAVAARLERAGLGTLFSLVERINGVGARWWVQVPGIGERKAARILDWLQANEDVLGGLRVGRHAAQPRAQLSPAVLMAVVSPATSLVPYEKFVLPAQLDGRAGHHRAPLADCRLTAVDDKEAIDAWLEAKQPEEAGEELASTRRSYRKEAERLLLWAILERGKALSSLSTDDASAYSAFLSDPPKSWCGPRHHQRWSPLWRPMEGPLSSSARRQSLTIVKGLFAFLSAANYVTINPFAELRPPPKRRSALGAGRTLSATQWAHLDACLARRAHDVVGRRLARAMRWLYETGLRLDEITRATCGDLRRVVSADAGPASDRVWHLKVIGRGGRSRDVPVPSRLVEELEVELATHGREGAADAAGNRHIALLARFGSQRNDAPPRWSASGLYQAIKAAVDKAARELDDAESQRLREASTHWLRHTHVVHSLQGRAGQSPVPIEVVQQNVGHASVATTALYLKP
ncbi:phage integrase family protein [Variovorax sp. GT1P44]|uniref:phage integrase family protein n=1 Tax=Variovorax sp. GT1P44 TaxID=3443742 RepID=UPI003F47ECF7